MQGSFRGRAAEWRYSLLPWLLIIAALSLVTPLKPQTQVKIDHLAFLLSAKSLHKVLIPSPSCRRYYGENETGLLIMKKYYRPAIKIIANDIARGFGFISRADKATGATAIGKNNAYPAKVADSSKQSNSTQKNNSFPPSPPSYALSRPMLTLADAAPKVEYINNFLATWENSDLVSPYDIPSFTAHSMSPYLACLSESFLFEEILEYRLSSACSKDDESKEAFESRCKRLKKLNEVIHPIIKSFRKMESTKRLEMLIASTMTSGFEELNNILASMYADQKLDAHLMTLLDEKILEARKKYSKNLESSEEGSAASEKLLCILKDRILAHKQLDERGVTQFVEALSFCLKEKPVNTRMYLKSKFRKIEDLDKFYEWLQDGLEYAEETGKLSEETMRVMKQLQRDTLKINPLYNQKLNKHSEMDVFVPDSSIQLDQDIG